MKIAKFFCKISIIIFFSLCFCVGLGQQVNRPLGINIAQVDDYSSELVFTDAFKQAREWLTSNADGSGNWDNQISIPLNQNGYPLQIPYNNGVNPPQIVKTLMLWDLGNAVPLGQYRLKVTGSGQVRLNFGADGTFNTPVDILVSVNGPVMLEVLSSNAANPISDIKFIYPDFVNTYQTNTYHPDFVTFLDDFNVIRFMDFTRTNNSLVETWSQRTPVNYYTQSKASGASWEHAIQLCNITGNDMWINIPHKADNNYITQLATLIQNNLSADRKVYIEYSNELWNGIFDQGDYAAQAGQNLGYTGQPWERTWKFTAKRSADVFKIFEDIFTNDQRLVKIIPSQASNSWLSNELITFFKSPVYNPNQVTASALAIAPYFGGEVADQIVTDGLVNSITVPQIVQRLQNSLPQAYQWISENKTVADNHNLQLIAYEGGQHLVATGNNTNNQTLTNKLMAANTDAQMQNLYCQYFNNWYNNIGTPFMHFSSHSIYSKYGSWGVKQTMPDVNNPKYLALKNCVINYNTLGVGNSNQAEKIQIYPNPAKEIVYIVNNSNQAAELNVVDASGKLMINQKINKGKNQVNAENWKEGIYFFSITSENAKQSEKVIIQ